MADPSHANKKHLVLVNKKSEKVSSSNSWLLALAARAKILGDTSGITSLLPLEEAGKLLDKNTLSIKTVRGLKGGKLKEDVRHQAEEFIPYLAASFINNHPKNKLVTRKSFCIWITQQLNDTSSPSHNTAILKGFEDLPSSPRKARWWQERLNKMQS